MDNFIELNYNKVNVVNELNCPWFNSECCDLSYSDKEECWEGKCIDFPNCYYRTTQEELTRLRTKSYLDFDEAIIERDHYIDDLQNELQASVKLKEVLTKIKGIAEDALNNKFTTKSEDYSDGMRTIASYVMSEINEVWNGN